MSKKNYQTPRGSDWTLNLTVENIDLSLKDLTSATLLMTLKTDKNLLDTDSSVIQIIPTTDVTPVDGKITASIPASTTINLQGTYYYDVKLKDAVGGIYYLADGVITFSSIVTLRTS